MAGNEEEKYLMFLLDDEFYGIPILKVNEIIGLMTITPMPTAPNYMKGVINLRGKIIPVLDLRLKFNMSEKSYDEQTCVIIVEMFVHGIVTLIGLVVDKVAEVVNVYQKDIEPPPEYGQGQQNDFLTGIGKVKDKVLMLLNIEAVINYKEVAGLIAENIVNKEPEIV